MRRLGAPAGRPRAGRAPAPTAAGRKLLAAPAPTHAHAAHAAHAPPLPPHVIEAATDAPLPAVPPMPRRAAASPMPAPKALSFATQPVKPSSGPVLTLPRLEVPVGGSVSG